MNAILNKLNIADKKGMLTKLADRGFIERFPSGHCKKFVEAAHLSCYCVYDSINNTPAAKTPKKKSPLVPNRQFRSQIANLLREEHEDD